MGSLDMQTIILSFGLIHFVSTLVIISLWTHYHQRFKGMNFLVYSYILQFIFLILIALRNSIPAWISIDFANIISIAGILSIYIGLEEYTGRRSNQIHNYILLIIYATVQVWFTFRKPDMAARILNQSLASLVFFIQCAWLMFSRVSRSGKWNLNSVGFVFVFFSLISAARVVRYFTYPHISEDFFRSDNFAVIGVILYQIVIILLTYSLILMVNKSLLADIKSERNLLRTLIDHLPDPVTIKDSNGQYVLNNKAHLDVIGVSSQDDTIGRTAFDYFPAGDASEYIEDDKLVLNSGKMIIDKVESAIHTKTGLPYWHLTSKIPIRDGDGKSTQLITISHDITERKIAEDALHESAELNRILLMTIPFAMDIVDEKGNILFQSDVFKSIFGYETLGKKCWELYRDDKKQCEECPLLRGIKNGTTELYESHGVLGGRIYNIFHTGLMFMGKQAMLEIFQDITEQKNAEADLIKAKEKAEEGDRLKTAFLHNVSHEIRTPLNAIIGFTSLLTQPDLVRDEQMQYLEIIIQNSDHLLAIVSDIIEISNVEAGNMKMNWSEIDINSIFTNLRRQFYPKAIEKEIELICNIPHPANNIFIYSDKTKLIQVLSNLLSNAFKFTAAGNITFGYSAADNMIECYVRDTGIGIPESQHDKIFNRFYQVDHKQTRVHEGTGLGLSISKAYIEFLGGSIWLKSEVGKGSEFYFSLPLGHTLPENI